MSDRLPNLLIIGAMKCGTSSIYAELSHHPDVFFPQNKEPNGLFSFLKDDAIAIEDYRALYRGRAHKYLGDASTGYSKFPVRPSIAGIAREFLQEDTKIIYVTRDPVARTERHLAHHIGNGSIASSKGQITSNPEYIALSAYEMQLSFWRAHFDSHRILELKLEDFLTDRPGTLNNIFAFLQLDPDLARQAEPANTNRGTSRRSAYRSPLKPLVHSRLYGKIRELLPPSVRRRFASLLLPKALNHDVQLGPEEIDFVSRTVNKFNQLDCPSQHEIARCLEDSRAELLP